MATGQAETIAERRKIALQLRQAGFTYRDLAVALTNKGFPCKFTTAYKDVRHCLKEISKQTHEEAEELRVLELSRLDTLLRSIWTKAIKGDMNAIDRSLKISERRCKLLGIDAPIQNVNEIIVPGAKNIQVEFIDTDDAD